MIYFDHAATSFLKPECVAQAVFDAMHQIGSDGRGVHQASLAAAKTVFRCRQQLAALFHAPDPSHVVFTANSTEALNMAIAGLFHQGEHVITTALEHNSVLRPLYRSGASLTVLPADRKGRISYEELEAAILPDTRGVVCTHVSNVTGNRLDLERIGSVCRRHGLLFIVDASQSAGVFEIDMKRCGISVLCFTGHKGLLGPQGTGGLCLAEGVLLPSFKVGGSGVQSFLREHPAQLPVRLEAGTLNAHGIAGLSAALSYLEEIGLETVRKKEQKLAAMFYERVRDIPDVTVYGDLEQPDRGAIVSLNLGDEDSGEVADALYQDYGICTRAGAHCAPLMHQAFGTQKQGMVRFSFSHLNTEEEVLQAAAVLRHMAVFY